MVLNQQIIDDLKQVSGLSFDQAKDYNVLAALITKKTGRPMGATTLKRLMGYLEDDRKANGFTLNTIAIYLGFSSWQDMLDKRTFDSVWRFRDEVIYIHPLNEGTRIKVKYLDRSVLFEVAVHEGQKCLIVISCKNGSLLPGDIVLLDHLRKGDIIQAEQIIRGEKIGNYKTKSEITHLEILN